MVGRTLAPIRQRYGDFDQWIQARAETPASYRVHYLFSGDSLPVLDDSDGWIITGSSESVNDQLPWLSPVKESITRAVDRGHPILGVCFGHQLIAVSCGGQVELNPKGWELGPADINLTPAGMESPLFIGFESNVSVYQTHREVVKSLPDEAQVLATNDMGLQAFKLGQHAFGVQFHPEFNGGIMQMYLALRSGQTLNMVPALSDNTNISRRVMTNFIQHIAD
ncbi:MAG: type 1 glutamine amidotransferase [Fidelibacterota bacterium]|nr:MAG: type 1 glutamine amidotransferase [Candidatus Neomarinimicrobiota bacterium]